MPICILKDIESSKLELDDVSGEAQIEFNYLIVPVKNKTEEFIYKHGTNLMKDQKRVNRYYNNKIEPYA